ncbi:hypothetical protein SMD44_08117 [Streptomyces alboflavus]|uniref:Uncharacterized protein n=1 Tax=Streptomyces alboflavus TaxID=67267 RepID=A0A1Z1WQE2_9ACTN|nr:hypothetical protein SMD44_08117 [Streptomyces alboflavus]
MPFSRASLPATRASRTITANGFTGLRFRRRSSATASGSVASHTNW